MKKIDAVYFDMDGTIADLYSIKNWLEYLQVENPYPYNNAKPMVNKRDFCKIVKALQKKGIKVGVITWLSKNPSKEYKKQVRKAKKRWLKENYNVKFDAIHVIKHGYPKHYGKSKNSIIVDDDEGVLASWTGEAIDAKQPNWLEKLQEMAI